MTQRCIKCNKFAKKTETFIVVHQGPMHIAGAGCRKRPKVQSKPRPKVVEVRPARRVIAGLDMYTALMAVGLVPAPSSIDVR